MRLFGSMYDATLRWASHKFAIYWLLFISFIESIFFPIPVDIMLVPMSISKPKSAFKYSLLAGVASALGGAVGYLIGHYFFTFIIHYIEQWGYLEHWDLAVSWFKKWGVLVVFIAGFAPIPYKVFTLCAGALQMAFLPFVLVSFISRTLRFVIVAKLSAWGGQRFAVQLRKYIEYIGWAVVVLAIVAYLIIR